MTKEQEEAIAKVNAFINIMKSDFRTGLYYKEYLEAIEIVLNLIQEQQKENEKKDKIIKRTENYVKQEIKCYTESINDYIDDDKKIKT